MNLSSDEIKELVRYIRWCGGALLFWIIAACTPATYAFPVAQACLNTVLFIVILPVVLCMAACAFAMNKPDIALLFIDPAIVIEKFLALVPGNPFAPDVYFLASLKVNILLLLDRDKEAVKLSRSLLRAYEARQVPSPGSIARTKVHLGTALGKLGEFEESAKLFDSAIAVQT